MRVNLVLIQPAGYQQKVYDEVIELYSDLLGELGYDVSFAYNTFQPDHLNMIFAYQRLPFSPQISKYKYVIVQLEQLDHQYGWFSANPENFNNNALPLLQNACQVWDFTPENRGFLKQYGINAVLVPLGLDLKLQKIEAAEVKDIDVLFYGSANDRRNKILKELEKSCQIVSSPGVFGQERDRLIARSKIVLNIHYTDLKIMEQARIFYLLTNRCFVLSEECSWNPYYDGIITVLYENLAEETLFWLAKERERQAIARRGFQRLKNIKMKEAVRDALAEIGYV
jgi:hypothetical protein